MEKIVVEIELFVSNGSCTTSERVKIELDANLSKEEREAALNEEAQTWLFENIDFGYNILNG